MDYRSRFKTFQSLGSQKDALFEELVEKLEAVSAQLKLGDQESERTISLLQSDLESEKESRRGWQDKAGKAGESLLIMEQAQFVLVLVDADADMYMFKEKYLSKGVLGGQAAADNVMEKVRDYLVSLGPSIHDGKTVPVMVKAYANLNGLAQACVRDRKLSNVGDMSQFWIGFSRRYPLFDFVDVGSGKEEADNKIREVLNFSVANPQCELILLACCNDAGYVPVLRQYAAQPSNSHRITLLSVGAIRSEMKSLGFKSTNILEPLFCSSGSPKMSPAVGGRSRQLSTTANGQKIGSTQPSSPLLPEVPVYNSGRLRPILRDESGKRIDKKLSVDDGLVQALRRINLCAWHYLRSDCTREGCQRNHVYPRPLKPKEYDALWFASRQGMCHRSRRGGVCEDDQCFYGHNST